jgi:ATP-dependent Clp protease adaptor protein ClpS
MSTELCPKVSPSQLASEPPRCRVVLLNDDYTPMDFVVEILIRVFHKSQEEAVRVMLAVHRQGLGVCGIYPFELAETKVAQVTALSRQLGHPLQCRLERL